MNEYNRGWVILAIAGLLEITWAIFMDYSHGFTVWYYSVLFMIALVASMILLSKALDTGIPMGTAYAVWTGIGAVGTITVSILLGNETADLIRVLFMLLILIGIAGLQVTSKKSESK